MKKHFVISIIAIISLASCQQKSVEKYMAEGLSAYNEKNYQTSVELFTAAIGVDETSPESPQ